MPRVFLCLAVVFLLIASAVQAQEASRLETIIQRGTLRVGMTGDYLPFTYFDKAASTFRGFDVDVTEALGKALGVKVEYVRTAWPQLSADFEADRFDMAMGGISITPEREARGLFSRPIMQEGKTPIARCADKGKYQTLRISTNRAPVSSSIPVEPTSDLSTPISGTPRSGSMLTTSPSSTRSSAAMRT